MGVLRFVNLVHANQVLRVQTQTQCHAVALYGDSLDNVLDDDIR